jgi:hypothetical protein
MPSTDEEVNPLILYSDHEETITESYFLEKRE